MKCVSEEVTIRCRSHSVLLLDKEIELDHNSSIFVTMNPASKKYGGRQKLPDNLKALFRPVAMSKPDNDMIASVSLHAEGFKSAQDLGLKLVAIFNLANGLLTAQQHYDWGLRALNAVLKGCGTLFKMVKRETGSRCGH